MPPPPSVAVNPAPKSQRSLVRFLVDEVPASAKFVAYAQLKMDGRTIDKSHAREVGEGLSKEFERMVDSARQKGANLIVLFSQAHGISAPIAQSERPLMLGSPDPVVTAVLFDWDSSAGLSNKEKAVRFTTEAPPRDKPNIQYKFELKVDTAGITESYWAYANIARFVKDAVDSGYDTVSIGSSQDAVGEDVWLPGCDTPLKVSNAKPELDVTIYKRVEAKK
jgi:hypothetical protein